MSELLFFIIGLLLGGCISFVILCCFQINRINAYESEIRKLKAQLSKEGKH
ncbi:MAG: inseCt neurotoxin 1c [Ruminococcaceae bacterium]|nr:inseCt neurotoxin 1c [Oscillospiraceae bacterium]